MNKRKHKTKVFSTQEKSNIARAFAGAIFSYTFIKHEKADILLKILLFILEIKLTKNVLKNWLQLLKRNNKTILILPTASSNPYSKLMINILRMKQRISISFKKNIHTRNDMNLMILFLVKALNDEPLENNNLTFIHPNHNMLSKFIDIPYIILPKDIL